MPRQYPRPRVALDARGLVDTHGPHMPKRGVLHSTECGDAQGIRELEGVVNFWHRQGLGYGAHLIIDKDGNTALCADFHRVAWHTAHRNTNTVGIELVGFARFIPKVWWLRRKQLDECAKWMAWLKVNEEIPLRFDVERGWSRHADQSRAFGGDHTDPGRGLAFGNLLKRANQYVASGW